MVIIDQSRAHQRVLYERFLSSITSKKSLSQQLLFPIEIKLNAIQINEYKEARDIIESLGFKIRQKEERILKIEGCPENFPQSKTEELIESILSTDYNEKLKDNFSQADKIAKILAKKLSIKTEKPLSLKSYPHF